MTLTIEQRKQVYLVLDAEADKAAKAADRAQKAYDYILSGASYGGSVESEAAAVLLSLRNAQREAAQAVLGAYFDAYIKDAA